MKLRSRPLSSLMVMVAAAVFALAAPAVGSEGGCPTGTGATVVVDFASFGGNVHVACASGSPGSGFEALALAGFDLTRVASNPGFLCRINELPGSDNEACQAIPPASAHWAYWTAVAGGEWSLSNSGATAAVSGDFEGWSFSTGQPVPPRYTIPKGATATTATTSTTTTTTTSTTSTTTTSTTVPPVEVSQVPPASAAKTTSTTVPVPTTTSASSDEDQTASPPSSNRVETTSPATETVVDAQADAMAAPVGGATVDPASESTGGQVGTTVAVLVITLGGASAWLVSRRRRRSTST